MLAHLQGKDVYPIALYCSTAAAIQVQVKYICPHLATTLGSVLGHFPLMLKQNRSTTLQQFLGTTSCSDSGKEYLLALLFTAPVQLGNGQH